MNTEVAQLKEWLGSGSINIFGRPYSGKDTQARRLAKIIDAPVIGGGQIIRSSQEAEVKKIIDKGILAPTEDYLRMVLPYFSQHKFAGKPLILSSVGRWFGEEKSVVDALAQSNHLLKAVIVLDISEVEVEKRWQAAGQLGDREQRADDAHGILDTRLDEFRKKTQPVIDYYEKLGLLIKIDGAKSPDGVQQDIMGALQKLVAL